MVSFHNQNLIMPRSVIIPPLLVHSHRGNDQEGGYRAQLQPCFGVTSLQSRSQRPRGVVTPSPSGLFSKRPHLSAKGPLLRASCSLTTPEVPLIWGI